MRHLRWLVRHQRRMVCLLGCPTRPSNRVCQILRFPPVCAHRFLVLSPSCSPGTTEHETTISRNYVTRGGWHSTQLRQRGTHKVIETKAERERESDSDIAKIGRGKRDREREREKQAKEAFLMKWMPSNFNSIDQKYQKCIIKHGIRDAAILMCARIRNSIGIIRKLR